MIGQLIGGSFDEFVVRLKSNEKVEIGELFAIQEQNKTFILQVYDLLYSSQLSQTHIEMIAGLKMEAEIEVEPIEKELTHYSIAMLKPLLVIENNKERIPKTLPTFFANLRRVEARDFTFLQKPENYLFIGKLRSGSRTIDVNIFLDAKETLKHHILIASTTGRGKSNLVKVMLSNAIPQKFASFIIFDAHNEYYEALKHIRNVHYYSQRDIGTGLKINITSLRPWHVQNVLSLSDAQRDAMYYFYNRFKENWIEEMLKRDVDEQKRVKEDTLAVLKRKFSLLGIEYTDRLVCKGLFDVEQGSTTINNICNAVEQCESVIIDTSLLNNELELLVSDMIAQEVFEKYKYYRAMRIEKPIVSLVIEEAPRVLGKDALLKGENAFSTIAREGRKFGVGLIAITQLPSLIPRDILANMNTKIILGIELKQERDSIINSAAQDLTKDSKAIASLDKGEALLTSHITKFVIPVKVPLFKENKKTQKDVRMHFFGT